MTKLLLIINYNKSFKVIITLKLRKLFIYGVSGVRLRLVLIKLFLHADRRKLPSSHMFCKSLRFNNVRAPNFVNKCNKVDWSYQPVENYGVDGIIAVAIQIRVSSQHPTKKNRC